MVISKVTVTGYKEDQVRECVGELQLFATVGMIQCIPNEELRESMALNRTDSARLTPNVASRNRKHLHLNTLP